MFLGSSHHILNFHVKQTSWIWILRNRHFLHMVAQHSIEVSSCPALITHIGRKWTRLQHWGLPYKCTSSFFFFFFASKSRHLLALEVDLCFTLIVGMPSILKIHHKFSDSAMKAIWRDQKSRPLPPPTPPCSLPLVSVQDCSTLLSSKLAQNKKKNSESLNKVSSGQVMQQDWPSWNS